ncbi:torsin-1B isoform X1 [Arapaima gigas]
MQGKAGDERTRKSVYCFGALEAQRRLHEPLLERDSGQVVMCRVVVVQRILGLLLAPAMEPISTSIAVGMAAALTGFLASYQNVFYYFHECCRDQWISFNRTGGTLPHRHS